MKLNSFEYRYVNLFMLKAPTITNYEVFTKAMPCHPIAKSVH